MGNLSNLLSVLPFSNDVLSYVGIGVGAVALIGLIMAIVLCCKIAKLNKKVKELNAKTDSQAETQDALYEFIADAMEDSYEEEVEPAQETEEVASAVDVAEEPIEETEETVEETVEEAVEEAVEEIEEVEEPVEAVEAPIEEPVAEEVEELVDDEYVPVTYKDDEEQSEESYLETLNESDLQFGEISEDELIMPKKHRPFDLRLRTANDNVKKRYSMIRNELESYGVKARTSRSRENYRKKGNVLARITFKGKTLCINLALQSSEVYTENENPFEFIDKAGYEEIPLLLKIKSAKNVKLAIELIGKVMEKYGYEKLAKHEPVDYVATFENIYSEFEAKGYGYLVEHTVTSKMVDVYRPVFAERIAVRIPLETEEPQRYIKASVRMTDINENFADGATVDLSALKEKGFAPKNANYLAISANKSISKRFFITANEISPRAVKMICLAGGQAYILYRKQKAVTE